MEKMDQLWPGGFRFLFDDALFQPGTDSFLLGSFPRLRRGERVCDLGGGTGLLGLLLLAREPSLHVTELEIQDQAVALCRRSAALNHLEDRLTCTHGDLRRTELLPNGTFDLVVANPPYFTAESGYHAENAARCTARTEVSCTLEDILTAAARLLRWGGRLCLVFRTERLAELMELSRRKGLEPKRLRLIQNTPLAAPSLLLLECRRGGKTGLQMEPPLYMQDEQGRPTPEVDRIYLRDKR